MTLFRVKNREDDHCSGMEAYKRIQRFAAEEYAFRLKESLTPAIFGETLQSSTLISVVKTS